MKYLTCPKCHEENPEKAIHCSVCGTRLGESVSKTKAEPTERKSPGVLKTVFAKLHLGHARTKPPHAGGSAHSA